MKRSDQLRTWKFILSLIPSDLVRTEALLRLGGIIVISISCTLSIHPQDLMEIYNCETLPDAEFPDASVRGLSGVV